MTRYLSATVLAVLATLACLYFMTRLINQPEAPPAAPPLARVEPAAAVPPPKPPKQPEETKPQPRTAMSMPGVESLAPTAPTAVTAVMKGQPSAINPTMGPMTLKMEQPPFTAGNDGVATPLVRMDPRYPADAARDGKEGWVKLRFTINTAGLVDDIQVIDASPKRIFNRAAIDALRKWRYKPQMRDGKPEDLHNQEVVLDFKLNQPA